MMEQLKAVSRRGKQDDTQTYPWSKPSGCLQPFPARFLGHIESFHRKWTQN